MPEPRIGPNDVLIEIARTSICGADLHIYKWDAWAQRTIPVTMVVGHEYCGRIREVGSELTGRPSASDIFDEQRSYPLIVHVYGGPGVGHSPQSYLNARSSHCRALAELGFVSIMLDTRRVAYRERAFNQVGYGGFLEPQLADHAAVVRQLCKR